MTILKLVIIVFYLSNVLARKPKKMMQQHSFVQKDSCCSEQESSKPRPPVSVFYCARHCLHKRRCTNFRFSEHVCIVDYDGADQCYESLNYKRKIYGLRGLALIEDLRQMCSPRNRGHFYQTDNSSFYGKTFVGKRRKGTIKELWCIGVKQTSRSGEKIRYFTFEKQKLETRTVEDVRCSKESTVHFEKVPGLENKYMILYVKGESGRVYLKALAPDENCRKGPQLVKFRGVRDRNEASVFRRSFESGSYSYSIWFTMKPRCPLF